MIQRTSRRWFRDESPARGDGDDPPCTGCVTTTLREPTCSPAHTRLTRVLAHPPAPLPAHRPTGQADSRPDPGTRGGEGHRRDEPSHRSARGSRTRRCRRWRHRLRRRRQTWSRTGAYNSSSDTSSLEPITTNFLTCKDLALYVQVSVQPGVQWSVSGEIMGVGSTTVLGSFAANGIGPTTYPQPPWIPGVSMCQHFGGPIAPPDHEYVATATARLPEHHSGTGPHGSVHHPADQQLRAVPHA